MTETEELDLTLEEVASLGTSIGPGTYSLFAASVAVCVGFFFWAYSSTLDIVSIANGEVIPSSQVKSVQHLEGGIVLDISVQ